jgi:hypothetical protein
VFSDFFLISHKGVKSLVPTIPFCTVGPVTINYLMIQLHNRLGSMALMDLKSYNSCVVLASRKCQKFIQFPKVYKIKIFFKFSFKAVFRKIVRVHKSFRRTQLIISQITLSFMLYLYAKSDTRTSNSLEKRQSY